MGFFRVAVRYSQRQKNSAFSARVKSSVFSDPCILMFSSLLGQIRAGVSRPWVHLERSAPSDAEGSSFLLWVPTYRIIFFFRLVFEDVSHSINIFVNFLF